MVRKVGIGTVSKQRFLADFGLGESVKQPPRESVKRVDTFRVLRLVEAQVSTGQMCNILHCSADAIKAHIKRLSQKGLIKREAYGVWKLSSGESVINPPGVSHNPPPTPPKIPVHQSPVSHGIPVIEAHDFWVTLEIPQHIKGWLKRRVWLVEKFPDPSPGLPDARVLRWKPRCLGSESVEFQGVTLWLNDTCVVGIMSKAYLGHSAASAQSAVLDDFLKVIEAFERVSMARLSFVDGYHVRLTDRRHYAKVDDPLARDYFNRRKKLKVKLSKGSLVIDHSKSVDHLEVEGANPEYMDGSVVPFFRDLELQKGFTPSFVISGFVKTIENTVMQQKLNAGFMERLERLEGVVLR